MKDVLQTAVEHQHGEAMHERPGARDRGGLLQRQMFLLDRLVTASRDGLGQSGKGSFGGLLDYLCDREGRICKGGAVLMARPTQIDDMARAHERKAAKRAIEDMHKKYEQEGVNVSMPGGGRDPTARAHNRHRSSFEPVQIPER